MTSPFVALWLVAADLFAAIGGIGVPFDLAAVGRPPSFLLLDWVVDLVERIDEILEAIVDLLETLRQLFGGGEAGD